MYKGWWVLKDTKHISNTSFSGDKIFDIPSPESQKSLQCGSIATRKFWHFGGFFGNFYQNSCCFIAKLPPCVQFFFVGTFLHKKYVVLWQNVQKKLCFHTNSLVCFRNYSNRFSKTSVHLVNFSITLKNYFSQLWNNFFIDSLKIYTNCMFKMKV